MSAHTKKLLFICGSLNQTTQMHQIAARLPEHELRFTPYYASGPLEALRRAGLVEFTILGARLRSRCLDYLKGHALPVDDGGREGGYDLVLTCSDLTVPENIRLARVVLVQEGMTDPETPVTRLVRALPFLPRWLAGTSATGASNAYERFCVASEGYRDHFIRRGADPERIVVTGIPNFDDCARYLQNDFPHRQFVLVCTSDMRETFVYENRRELIRRAVQIADGRQLIFKLHPNENTGRAREEVRRWAPGALVYTAGRAEEMVANCDVLITRRSSLAYVGIALGKQTFSDFDMDDLRRMVPDQHGMAAENIAAVARMLLEEPPAGEEAGRAPRAARTLRRRSLRRRYARGLVPAFPLTAV